MLAEIGGYVGLLLGVSLFKLADINNFFIDWVISNNVTDEDDKENKSGKKPSPFDAVMARGTSWHM